MTRRKKTMTRAEFMAVPTLAEIRASGEPNFNKMYRCSSDRINMLMIRVRIPGGTRTYTYEVELT